MSTGGSNVFILVTIEVNILVVHSIMPMVMNMNNIMNIIVTFVINISPGLSMILY